MSPASLNRAVARATGESLREIRRRGFSLVTVSSPLEDELETLPQILDWDLLQGVERSRGAYRRRWMRRVAA